LAASFVATCLDNENLDLAEYIFKKFHCMIAIKDVEMEYDLLMVFADKHRKDQLIERKKRLFPELRKRIKGVRKWTLEE
jgi:hypothetical protein